MLCQLDIDNDYIDEAFAFYSNLFEFEMRSKSDEIEVLPGPFLDFLNRWDTLPNPSGI